MLILGCDFHTRRVAKRIDKFRPTDHRSAGVRRGGRVAKRLTGSSALCITAMT